MLRNPAQNLLYVGDRAYGIFRVLQTARQAGACVLVRLTQSRAFKVAGKPIRDPGSYPVSWAPSPRDKCQHGCSKEPVQGRLLMARLQRNGFRDEILYLFTTLTDQTLYTDAELLALYGWRWRVELNFRYLKSQLEMDQFECCSARMAVKEWQAGLLAYNLIRLLMYQAAAINHINPDMLSFNGSRRIICRWLENFASNRCRRQESLQKLFSDLAHMQLPNRRKPRPSEPRRKRQLRETFPPLKGSRDLARKQLLDGSLKN